MRRYFNAQSHAQLVSPQIQGFRELLQYTGFAWVMETQLASVEEINSYWENVPPIWEVGHGGGGYLCRKLACTSYLGCTAGVAPVYQKLACPALPTKACVLD